MTIDDHLIRWYRKNQRKLPWRLSRDPYEIWVSEIILQQTRVEQGLPYYQRFMERFPSVELLAAAAEEELLYQWQGLGYYTRARNMHKTANYVVASLGSVFPTDHSVLLRLPGIGPYTAAAIASMAGGQATPVVDGNVIRVITRIFGIDGEVGKRETMAAIQNCAHSLLHGQDPGEMNQALMEFGALQCVPVKPDCTTCPVVDQCSAFATDRVSALPRKKPKTSPRPRFLHALVFYEKTVPAFTYLTRRDTNDIWKGLYSFPFIEKDALLSWEEIIQVAECQSYKISSNLEKSPSCFDLTHVLTHQKLYVRFFVIHISGCPQIPFLPESLIRVEIDSLMNYPMPRLMHRFLDRWDPRKNDPAQF